MLLLSSLTGSNLLRVTAVLEGGTALALLLLPSLPSELLLGQTPGTPLGVTLARFAGVALLSLSTACWWAASDAKISAASGILRSLLLYDALAAALLVYARLGLGLGGIALWPAVVAHVVLAWFTAR